MGQLILQPCGNKDAREHYQGTMANPVPEDTLSRFLDTDQMKVIRSIYGARSIPTWGVVPGGRNVNAKAWRRVMPGAVAVFSKDGGIFASGLVAFKVHARDLANELWGKDANGNTWEYVYFLDGIKSRSIPYIVLNQALGYADNFVIQGFRVLDDPVKHNAVVALLGEKDTEREVRTRSLMAFEGVETLDADVQSTSRVEQTELRKILLGGRKKARCSLCHKEFPAQFLVAAHIKKRSKCSLAERLDENVAMLACKLGCDELYEQFAIKINPRTGLIEKGRHFIPDAELEAYIKQLEGRRCAAWSPSSKKYYEWHYRQADQVEAEVTVHG